MKHIPNILSSLRIAMVGVFAWLFITAFPNHTARYGWALGMFVLAFLTDVLDGFLARTFNWVTPVGKLLDPLADKLMSITALIVILIGKARELAAPLGYAVKAVLPGENTAAFAEELRHYGVEEIAVYDDPELRFFRAETYAACVADYIRYARPSVVLVGATSLGRSLAPRLATRFRTGLTADCTRLELRGNSDLVQIRPAFGGNIMAQIVTTATRPQFATVRYKVMNPPERAAAASGTILNRPLPKEARQGRVTPIRAIPVPRGRSISDAEVLVVGGRGLQKESDLEMIRELAALLGGDWATTRPLVEKGWTTNDRQIGLSGRTVRPKLIITCGVSGAIQFTSCMNASEHIIAINSDPAAPIFETAHIAIVDDLYHIVPEMIRQLKEGRA